MKIVKYIAGFLLMLLCFSFSGEIFQNYLNNFYTDYYYFEELFNNDIGSRAALCSHIAKSCNNFSVKTITVVKEIGAVSRNIIIYSSNNDSLFLNEKKGLSEGTFDSLFSGPTNVIISNLYLFPENSLENKQERYYLIGDEKDIQRFHSFLLNENNISKLHKGSKTYIQWIYYGLWTIILLLLLILCWFDIQFSKKEYFLKLSMGYSLIKIIMKNIFLDLTVFIIEFTAEYVFLGIISYVDFKIRTVLIIFSAFLVVVSTIQFSIIRYDYKEILYGANINQKLLAYCFVFKAIVIFFLVLVLGQSAFYISENYALLQIEKNLDLLEGYSYLNWTYTYIENDAGKEYDRNIIKSIFLDNYYSDKVALATTYDNWAEDKEENIQILLFNNICKHFIKSSEINEILNSERADFYVFSPETKDKSDELLRELKSFVNYTFGIKEDECSFATIAYKDKLELSYFDIAAEYGFDIADDPCFIYINISGEDLMKISDKDVAVFCPVGISLFNISENEFQEHINKYGLDSLKKYEIKELCMSSLRNIKRIIYLDLIICVFLILTVLFMTTSIIKLEYLVNQKEFVIKKILGYSIIKKHEEIFILNFISIAIGIIISVIIVLVTNNQPLIYPVIVGLGLGGIEFLIEVIMIGCHEKQTIIKVLKGGIA